MLTLFSLASSWLWRACKRLVSLVVVRVQHLPLVVKGIAAVYVGLTLTIFGILRLAQTAPLPTVYELPQAYLPGNPLPATVKVADCANFAHQKFSTPAEVDGRTVYLTYIFEDRKIIRASVRSEDYNIGELVTAWGRPTGITRHGATILVSWGRRSVTLYTSFFKPDRPISFIAYDNDQPTSAAWRGFMNKMHDQDAQEIAE
jgi:hypothetical protein